MKKSLILLIAILALLGLLTHGVSQPAQQPKTTRAQIAETGKEIRLVDPSQTAKVIRMQDLIGVPLGPENRFSRIATAATDQTLVFVTSGDADGIGTIDMTRGLGRVIAIFDKSVITRLHEWSPDSTMIPFEVKMPSGLSTIYILDVGKDTLSPPIPQDSRFDGGNTSIEWARDSGSLTISYQHQSGTKRFLVSTKSWLVREER